VDPWSDDEQGFRGVPRRFASPSPGACPSALTAGMLCSDCSPDTDAPVLETDGVPSLFAQPTAKNGRRLPKMPNTAMVSRRRPATRTRDASVQSDDVEGASPGVEPYPASARSDAPAPGKLTVRFIAPERGGDPMIGLEDIARVGRAAQWRVRRAKSHSTVPVHSCPSVMRRDESLTLKVPPGEDAGSLVV
jgi:hypothetical protein